MFGSLKLNAIVNSVLGLILLVVGVALCIGGDSAAGIALLVVGTVGIASALPYAYSVRRGVSEEADSRWNPQARYRWIGIGAVAIIVIASFISDAVLIVVVCVVFGLLVIGIVNETIRNI